MAGSELPAAGYISNDARQEVEVKASFEEMIAVARRTLGATNRETIEISAGSITPTGDAVFLDVAPEGGSGPDFLDFIDGTNYAQGSIVVVYDSSQNVTIRHGQVGSGKLNLAGFGTLKLDARVAVMFRLSIGGSWNEVFRGWGDDPAALRSFLQLGTAALHDEGPGNGLDADTLDGLNSTDFYQVGNPVGEASTVGGVGVADLVRLSLASLQTLTGELQSDGGAIRANTPAAGLAARHEMRIEGVLRASVSFDDVNDRLEISIFEADGATKAARLQLDVASGWLFYDPLGNGGLFQVWHAGNDGDGSGLDADTVRGQVPVLGTVTRASAAAAFPGGSLQSILTLNARSFLPSASAEPGITFQLGYGSADDPEIVFRRTDQFGNSNFSAEWDYIA